MEKLIPAADDGSEFAEVPYDLSQAEAEKTLGADFAANDESESTGMEGENHG